VSSRRTPRGSTNGRHRLYREFEAFYREHRCAWSPPNPRRIFNLCFKTFYPAYRRRLTRAEFLAVMYDTLGVQEGEPRGLFQTFDPAKYKGKLPLDSHFVNLFKKKLWGKVFRRLRPPTDQGRPADPARFLPRPELGLWTAKMRSVLDRALQDAVHEALDCLDEVEQAIIRLAYWCDLSARCIGRHLRLDHKTVGRKHERALQKLRACIGLAA
jgi:RNA polymerase sigma factor (sigma-70 family)